MSKPDVVLSRKDVAHRAVKATVVEVMYRIGTDYEKLPDWDKNALEEKISALARKIGSVTR